MNHQLGFLVMCLNFCLCEQVVNGGAVMADGVGAAHAVTGHVFSPCVLS